MFRSRHNPKALTVCICTAVSLNTAMINAAPAAEAQVDSKASEEITEETRQAATSELEVVTIAIDDAHKDASELLNGFASQIDNYFADENSTEQINNTSATVRFDFNDPGDDNFSIKTKLKLRLVLPRSEQRVRLLFDVDGEDIDDGNRSIQSLTTDDNDGNLALALRFIRRAQEQFSFNADLGMRRFDKKIQGFARLRVSAEQQEPDAWSYRISNDYREYFSSGYLNRLSFDFWHTLNDPSATVFRTSSNFEWRENAPGMVIGQTAGFYRELDEKSLLALEALARYKTSPEEAESHYEGHQMRVRYRRNAYRPWFHYEVWPSVSWLKENNNKPELGALFRVEVSFGQY